MQRVLIYYVNVFYSTNHGIDESIGGVPDSLKTIGDILCGEGGSVVPDDAFADLELPNVLVLVNLAPRFDDPRPKVTIWLTLNQLIEHVNEDVVLVVVRNVVGIDGPCVLGEANDYVARLSQAPADDCKTCD